MSTWLARLKNQNTPGAGAAKPTKPVTDTPKGGFVGFVVHPQGHIQNFDRAVASPETTAANAPAIDPARWAWPHSNAMNGQELDTFMARQNLFRQRGTTPQDAERVADKLVGRDRGEDDRRLCLECRHLRGESTYRCGNARAAGLHPDLARDMVLTLQHCHGYDAARLPIGVIVDAAPPAPAAAPPEPAPAPSWSTWCELDHAYLAHHIQCTTCQGAGRGYGRRCDSGMELWTTYSSMNSDLKG
ncbi:MAG: hypothetical protein ACTS6O_06715 [Giesbergeria sp.]